MKMIKRFMPIVVAMIFLVLSGCTRVITSEPETEQLSHTISQTLIDALKNAQEKTAATSEMFDREEESEEDSAIEENAESEQEESQEESVEPQGDEEPVDTDNATTTNVPDVPFPIQ
jgi:Flp pilus assembly protein TadD